MKQLLSLVFVLSYFLTSAQEIDLSFANNGILPLTNSPRSIKALGDGFMITSWDKVEFYDDNGRPDLSLGKDGVIKGPFLGSNEDIISDAVMVDDKLLILGCALTTNQGYDVYTRQFDVSTGDPIDGTTYTMPDPNDEEYIIPYVGSEVSLFGYSTNSSDVSTLAHNTYNLETRTFSELVIEDFDSNPDGSFIPYNFTDLPDGRIIAFYSKNFKGNISYQIIDDIAEVSQVNSSSVLSSFENGIQSGFVNLDESTLLAIGVYANPRLVTLDLNTNSHDYIDLDFLPSDFTLSSIQPYDEETFLLFGINEGQVEIIAMSKDFELKGLGSSLSLIVSEAGSDNISISSFKIGDYIYGSTFGSEGIEIFRLKNGISSISDEQLLDFAIYPSPAVDMLNLDGLQIDAKSKYTIYNSNGQLVQKDALTTKSIDVSTLESGVFYITVQANNSESTKSFVIERN